MQIEIQENTMNKKWMGLFKVGLAVMALTCIATAQEEKQPDQWQFGVAPYAWFTTIEGNMNMGLPGVEVSPDDLLSNLELGALVSGEARYNRWLVMLDVVYLKASGNDKVYDGTLASVDAELDVESWTVDLYSGYNAVQSEKLILDAVVGLRYFSMANDLTLKGSLGVLPPGTYSDTAELLNGVVGVRGAVLLGKQWFLPYHLDAGAGDAQFTWQGMAGVGYSFNWLELIAAYRYLSFDVDGGTMDSMTISGPILGLKFVF